MLINAISIMEGGGLVVLIRLLESMSTIDPNITWYVAGEHSVLTQLPRSDNFFKLPYDWVKKSPMHHLFWYEVVLPKLVRNLKIDVFFSKTNFLPKRPLPCPSLLLVQHAGYFSEHFKKLYFQWYNSRITRFIWERKSKWLYQSIRQATIVTVQTESLAKKIIDKVGISNKKIIVIPHGPGLLKPITNKIRKASQDGIWRIGYITKFGVQKDFITAIKAISLLRKKGMKVKFVLTLAKNNDEYKLIYKIIRQYKIDHLVENHGEVTDASQLQSIYESLHIFIFPSLCESFGFTLVEAMVTGLPVIVSDTDNNREIVGDSGEIFSIENENQLAEKIYQFIDNNDLYLLASKNSLEQSRKYCWIRTANNILKIIYHLVDNKYAKAN